MKAVIIQKDKSLKTEVVEKVQPTDGQVLIKVYAAAINRADLLQREGSYPPPPGCPEWPGLEVAGRVESAPNGSKWKKGDKVCALLGGGGYAEYAAADEGCVMPIPSGLDYTEAVALPEVYATAYLNLKYVAKAKRDETLLIFGGTSGLASAVIPMAKIMGMKVVATVRGTAKAETCKQFGADVVIDTKNESLQEKMAECEKNGYAPDVVIDCLGGDYPTVCMPYVNRFCRWISIATLAGDISAVNFRTVFVKNIQIIGSTLRSKPKEFKAELLSSLVKDMWPSIESGAMRPIISAVLPLDKAQEAQQLLYDGKALGKVVLKVVDEE